jgi:hypothetical protein
MASEIAGMYQSMKPSDTRLKITSLTKSVLMTLAHIRRADFKLDLV